MIRASSAVGRCGSGDGAPTGRSGTRARTSRYPRDQGLVPPRIIGVGRVRLGTFVGLIQRSRKRRGGHRANRSWHRICGKTSTRFDNHPALQNMQVRRMPRRVSRRSSISGGDIPPPDIDHQHPIQTVKPRHKPYPMESWRRMASAGRPGIGGLHANEDATFCGAVAGLTKRVCETLEVGPASHSPDIVVASLHPS